MSDARDDALSGPLAWRTPPAIPVELLVSVDVVTLAARQVPGRVLRDFYEHVLQLTFVAGDERRLEFKQRQRRLVLRRDADDPGRAGLLIRGFDEALLRLRERRIACEVLHTDSGLTRMATLRDPAGNWIHLLETRPL